MNLRDIKIGSRLNLGFGLVIILAALIGIISLNKMKTLSGLTEKLYKHPLAVSNGVRDINSNIIKMHRSMKDVALARDNAGIQSAAAQVVEYEEEVYKHFELVEERYLGDKSDVIAAHDLFKNWKPIRDEVISLMIQGERQTAADITKGKGAAHVQKLDAAVEGLIEFASNKADSFHANAVKTDKDAAMLMYILLAVSIVVAIVIAYVSAKSIRIPLSEIKELAQTIASGDLSQKSDDSSRDEVGELAVAINGMVDNLKQNNDEMESNIEQGNKAIEEIKRTIPIFIEQGDLDIRPDVNLVDGAYKEVLQLVSGLIDGMVKDIYSLINGFNSYADGNFDYVPDVFPGKKVVITDALNKLRNNLLLLIKEGVELAKAAEEGDLKKRGDVSKFEGDYIKIIEGFNNTITNILDPINESVKSLEAMATGDLTVDVTGDYRGDHQLMKNAINSTQKSLNDLLGQVNVAVEQVNGGSQQVSDSSQSLSQGATEQASSLEEVTSSIAEIGSQTNQNAENATQANKLANTARGAADNGNDQMQQMLGAMNEITESSNEISKIIKVIDEIAFQTNLLALNAAVEAARAGVHGKGFAVVADEVRNLAQRSAQAAKETTALIEGTVQRVENGSSIADETAEALTKIIDGITKVNDLVGEIESASKEQTVGINQIGDALSQIDSVTQANTSNAEEGASAAEELSSQAIHLKQMVSKFKLTSNGELINPVDRRLELPTVVNGNGNGWEQKALPDKKIEEGEVGPVDVISLEDSDFENF